MRLAILTCILGDFDIPIDPVEQTLPENCDIDFHRWTDEDFPPVTGLTPRLQYRIPKTHGFQMYPDYNTYIWLDGTQSFTHPNSVKWFVDQLGDADIALFAHPYRKTVSEEVAHIETHLNEGKPYITERYKNGLHVEQFADMLNDPDYIDNALYASTVFIYRNTPRVQAALKDWWYYGSRYFTCDQVVLPYILQKHRLNVNVLDGHIYKSKYLTEVSKH